jgi:hypothetical protein
LPLLPGVASVTVAWPAPRSNLSVMPGGVELRVHVVVATLAIACVYPDSVPPEPVKVNWAVEQLETVRAAVSVTGPPGLPQASNAGP